VLTVLLSSCMLFDNYVCTASQARLDQLTAALTLKVCVYASTTLRVHSIRDCITAQCSAVLLRRGLT
jgi:hypothetical protein